MLHAGNLGYDHDYVCYGRRAIQNRLVPAFALRSCALTLLGAPLLHWERLAVVHKAAQRVNCVGTGSVTVVGDLERRKRHLKELWRNGLLLLLQGEERLRCRVLQVGL